MKTKVGDRIRPCINADKRLHRRACLDWVTRRVVRVVPAGVYIRFPNGTEVLCRSWVRYDISRG